MLQCAVLTCDLFGSKTSHSAECFPKKKNKVTQAASGYKCYMPPAILFLWCGLCSLMKEAQNHRKRCRKRVLDLFNQPEQTYFSTFRSTLRFYSGVSAVLDWFPLLLSFTFCLAYFLHQFYILELYIWSKLL